MARTSDPALEISSAPRSALRRIHPAAGLLALGLLFVFWTSTAAVELFGTERQIVLVKQGILWGLAALIPALALAGTSGARLARGSQHPRAADKRARMLLIAANGVIVLAPAAVFLAAQATAGVFDGMFHAVQAVELAAGALNATLLLRQVRDGRRLSRR